MQSQCPQPLCPRCQRVPQCCSDDQELTALTPGPHIPSLLLTCWFLGGQSQSSYLSLCKIPQDHIFKEASEWLLTFQQQLSSEAPHTQNSFCICTDREISHQSRAEELSELAAPVVWSSQRSYVMFCAVEHCLGIYCPLVSHAEAS